MYFFIGLVLVTMLYSSNHSSIDFTTALLAKLTIYNVITIAKKVVRVKNESKNNINNKATYKRGFIISWKSKY